MLRVSIGLFKRPSRCAGSAPERSQPTEASLKTHFAWIGLLEAECERERKLMRTASRIFLRVDELHGLAVDALKRFCAFSAPQGVRFFFSGIKRWPLRFMVFKRKSPSF